MTVKAQEMAVVVDLQGFVKKKKKPLQTVYKYNSIWLNITIPSSEPVIDLFIFLHFAILKFGSFGHS